MSRDFSSYDKWMKWEPANADDVPEDIQGHQTVRVKFADGNIVMGEAWSFNWGAIHGSKVVKEYEVVSNPPVTRFPDNAFIPAGACVNILPRGTAAVIAAADEIPGVKSRRGSIFDPVPGEIISLDSYSPGDDTQPVKVTDSGLKDSGTRRDFNTGAQRDAVVGKGRYDLMSWAPQKREAQIMEKGAIKYAARNWEKGIPLSVFINSAFNHLEKLKAGFEDEDHAAMARWNISQYIETEERIKRGLLPKELDDMPHTYRGQNPGF